MEADGGMGKYSANKAGAKYGTGYCDSQCPHDIKYINGEVKYFFNYLFFCPVTNTLTYRLTSKDGRVRITTTMPERANTVHAAMRWISGRPIASPPPIPHMVARSMAPTAVPERTAVTAPTTDMEVSAIRTDAISTPIVWVILHSMAQA
jgi:hypothetical protein